MFRFGFQSNCMVVDFNSTEQLNYNLQCNCLDFTQSLSCCPNYNKWCWIALDIIIYKHEMDLKL
jgi:hypothetical protein